MPIKKLILFYCCTVFGTIVPNFRTKPYTIMLEPAGDAKHTGREIDDSFERGITLQYAEKLKKQLETEFANIRVVLSRSPAEIIEPLQNAHFANRLGVDLYLSFHVYQEQEEKTKLYLYQFIYDPITDFWDYPTEGLQFIRYDQAHRAYAKISKMYGELVIAALQENQYLKLFEVKGFFAMPFKPLIGIKCPALGFEFGLKKKNDWLLLVEPIVDALKAIIEQELKAYRS